MLLGTPDGVIVEDTEDRERAWGKMCLASKVQTQRHPLQAASLL